MGWQIVVTRPHCEAKVSRQLSEEGVENYYPLQRRWRRVRHKRHPVLQVRAAFPGYVFARPPIAFRLRDARPLVIGDWLAEVRDSEIERLQQVEFLVDEGEKFKRKPRAMRLVASLLHCSFARRSTSPTVVGDR
jgi:hypothetical protein